MTYKTSFTLAEAAGWQTGRILTPEDCFYILGQIARLRIVHPDWQNPEPDNADLGSLAGSSVGLYYGQCPWAE